MNKFAILEELEGIEEFCKQYLQKQGYIISRPETKVEVNSYLKVPKLSKEAFDKIEEIDNTPLTEKEKQSIKEFKEKVNKFYGTMEDKEWIHEKCNTNTPPTSVPEHPSKGNKKKLFSETEEQKIAKITETCLKDLIRDELKEQVQKDKFKELNKINGEIIYWDIYCEKETSPEIREKIEKIYPDFKEKYSKLMKQNNEDISVKTNKQKREFKYYDIINLIGHIVDHKIQRHILEERKERAVWPKFQEPIIDKIKELDKKYLNWLEEEV